MARSLLLVSLGAIVHVEVVTFVLGATVYVEVRTFFFWVLLYVSK